MHIASGHSVDSVGVVIVVPVLLRGCGMLREAYKKIRVMWFE